MNKEVTNDIEMSVNAVPTGGTIQVGTIVAYLGKVVPDTWLACDGSEIPSQYNTLISLIGNYTPNLGGRTLIGIGKGTDANDKSNTYALKATGGEYTNTLTVDNIPAHTHAVSYSFWGSAQGGGTGDSTNLEESTESKNTSSAGGGDPHNNMQPYYAVSYIIYAGTN